VLHQLGEAGSASADARGRAELIWARSGSAGTQVGWSSAGRSPALPALGQGGPPASAMVAQELGTPWLKRAAAGGGRQALEGGGRGSRPAPWWRRAHTRAQRAYKGRGGRVWGAARDVGEEGGLA
jgi:hypothetical protein